MQSLNLVTVVGHNITMLPHMLHYYKHIVDNIFVVVYRQNEDDGILEEIENIILNKNDFQNQKMNDICSHEDIEVSIEAFLNKKNVQFIDIREMHEQPKIKNFNVKNSI